eukprot:3503695-Rhodomonas_salina.2
MRTGAHGGVQTEVTEDCELLSLTPALLGHLWPAERGVVGLRVCKQLRRDLIVHSGSIVLVGNANAMQCAPCVSADFRRLPQHILVMLTCKKSGAMLLLEVLNECKALAGLDFSENKIRAEEARALAEMLRESKVLTHLDLGHNGIGAQGAGALAMALGECKALAHLALSHNNIGAEGAGELAGVM